MDKDKIGLGFFENIPKAHESTGRDIIKGLSSCHDVKVIIRLDVKKGHDLIQHFPVLGRHSNNRFDSVRIFPHFENKRTHLDGLRPRSKDCHDFKFFHNYAPILAILQDADFLGTNEDVFTNELYADHINFMSVSDIRGTMEFKAKIRYSHSGSMCKVTRVGEDRIHCEFEEPVRAVTPGQAVVLYDGDYVAGGGIIC